MSKGKNEPFGLNKALRYVFTSQGLVSDHRPSTQSPLGLFCPKSKAHDHSWLGRSGKGCWHLLSIISGLLSQNTWWSCHWPCFEMNKQVELLGRHCQALERDWVAVCWLQTLHLTHSHAELWPKFLRFALWGARALRVPAWSPACGHWSPRLATHFPVGLGTLWDETGAEYLGVYI